MNIIVILVFSLTAVPYLGLPQAYDIWIVLPLVGALLYALYTFARKHNVHVRVSKDSEDDFFEQNKEEISPELGTDTTK